MHVLRDGTRILIRPLVPDDRDELRAKYSVLSAASRRLRFVSPPGHLTERLLDYLLDVDFDDRCAIVAALADGPGEPGVGIARYARRRDDPTTAEAAVTVLDEYHGRGIGTLLLAELVTAALRGGVTAFVADVMWENAALLASLRAVGARVVPGEPGLASVSVSLPVNGLPTTIDEIRSSPLYQVMRTIGSA